MKALALLVVFFALPGCTAFVGVQTSKPDSATVQVANDAEGMPHILYAEEHECIGISITVSEGSTSCGESAQLVEWMGDVLRAAVSFTGRLLPAGFSDTGDAQP